MAEDSAAASSRSGAAPAGRAYRDGWVTSQDGLRLYHRDYRPAPGAPERAVAVLCLGGLTRNSRDFNGPARWLQGQGFRVIAADYRGRGRSEYDPDWRNYRPETYIEDARHLCCALGLHAVVVIGTSLGGALAMGLAVAMPTVLKGAVLNDIGPKVVRRRLAGIFAFMREGASFETWEDAAAHLRHHFPHYPAAREEDWIAIARGTYREGPDGRLVFDWDANILKRLEVDSQPEHDLERYFRALGRRPVLALRGARSDILDAETFAAMAAMLPDIRCVEVPGVGHAPGLAEPTAREALHDFFARF